VTSTSLVGRIVVLQQITALCVIAAFAISSLVLTRHVLVKQQRAAVAAAAVRSGHEFDEEMGELGVPTAAAAKALEEGAAAGVRVEIRDSRGALIGAAGRVPSERERTTIHGKDRAEYAAVGGAKVLVMRTGTTLIDELSALAWALLLSALPILLATFLLGRELVRRAMRPLSAMARRAEAIEVEGSGTLGPASGLEEIDRLGGAFGRLLERLRGAVRAERRFTADASHELRTPLTAISGELEMATARARGQSELADGLGRARSQVGAMRELVEALLLLRLSDEGAEQDAFEWVNLGDVVRDTTATLRERCPARSRDIEIDAPDEVLVRGNPALLAAGVRNLLDNALKFTQQSQRVRVAVTADDTAGRITVDDAGAGVPVPERERVFDSFFRGAEARADRPGFGLGLPILRRVARVHGGDVTLADSPLGGARFELWIPLAADTEHGAVPSRQVAAAPDVVRAVDDSPPSRVAMRGR